MNTAETTAGGGAGNFSPSVRLLHLSDLHIGKRLHDYDRASEYEALLRDLVREAESFRPHGILISGDVFDGVNPSIDAEMFFGRLLLSLHQAVPEADLIITAGNHDSSRKIDSIAGYTSSFCDRIFLMGSLPLSQPPGTKKAVLHLSRMIRPVKDSSGQILCLVAAVPFVSEHVLFSLYKEDDKDQDGKEQLKQKLTYSGALERLYQELLSCAREEAGKLPSPVPVVAMGHCFVSSASLTEEEKDKRDDFVGGTRAVSAGIFRGYDYTALGHIHLAQNATDRIRYSGSPFPVNFGEISYKNGVTEVSLGGSRDGEGLFSLESKHRLLTREVQFLRIPDKGFGSEKQIRDLLAALPEIPDLGRRPFCRIHVRYDPNDSEYTSLSEFRSALNELTGSLQNRGCIRFCGVELENVSSDTGSGSVAMIGDLRDVPSPRDLIMKLFRENNSGREMDENTRRALEEILQELQSAARDGSGAGQQDVAGGEQ